MELTKTDLEKLKDIYVILQKSTITVVGPEVDKVYLARKWVLEFYNKVEQDIGVREALASAKITPIEPEKKPKGKKRK